MHGRDAASAATAQVDADVRRPPTKRTVRVIFGATLLSIAVLQYVLLGLGRAEPYPAVILPGFPAQCAGCLLQTGVATAKEPSLLVRFSDGSSQRLAFGRILPPGPSVRLMAFTAAFDDEAIARDPEAVAYLRSEVNAQFPRHDVSGLDIIWRTATYDKPSVSYTPANVIHVDFGAMR